MTIHLRIFLLAPFFILCGCADEAPAATTPETTVPQADRAAMAQDQTRGTRNANPEVVAPERLDSPTPTTPTPGDAPKAAPEKTVQDQTRGTRNANPETVAPERLNDPEIRREAATERTGTPAVTENETTSPMEPEAEPETSPASTTSPEPAAAASGVGSQESGVGSQEGPPSHAAWQTLLKTYVDANGNVNYAGLRSQEKALNAYLAELAAAIPKETWSTNQALAYWLNAYNAYTFKLILNNYPVRSITDLDGGDPWKKKWIQLEDKLYSLNEIEHDIIRPRFQDPRIHFAVVCAAKSCPPLANEAFTAANVKQLLEQRTRKFINNERYNQPAGDNPKVSKIFEWYAEDFGDVKAYLNKYLKTPIRADAELGYLEYDWALNKQ